ncbi:FeoA domain-containing protein [Vulcanisaeta sp. JCM 16159]|uniref:FeoA domain-containing protein n=1 Tax=Vulcanisaeta sp. JCM 16159 TaxID=1295371 RepID=UPI0006CF85BA|nr:FeoA domain-containing protein [Vulcanisaeta sp. JCM 16159]
MYAGSEGIPINKAPNNSIVRIVRPGSDRLIDLGLMSGSIVKVLISMPCGPVLAQREDGSVIVLDADTASNTFVTIISMPEPARHRHRWRRGWRL